MTRLIDNQQTSAYDHLFGPVISRRLGISLGIDMIPFKTCSMNCVYCECGKTTHFTATRKEYVPAHTIIAELDRFLISGVKIDVVTFGGSGEPTLSTALGTVLNHVRKKYPHIRTALLTNSSLLWIPEVRQDALSIDFVLPSLDAVTGDVSERINHPVSPDVTVERIIEGLVSFSHEYRGNLWVEVFIIPGINDTQSELSLLKDTLRKIRLTRVQLNSLDRPGTCSWVKPAPDGRLREIADFLLPLPVEIITRKTPAVRPLDQSDSDLKERIIGTIKRRPMTVEDCAVAFSQTINVINELLEQLKTDAVIMPEVINSKTFYRLKGVL